MKQGQKTSNGVKKPTVFILIFAIIILIAGGFLLFKKNNPDNDFGPAIIVSQSAKDKQDQDKNQDNNIGGQNKAPDIIEIGSPDAPVTIVEYYSYFCGHCAQFNSETLPKIKEQYIDTGKVRFVYRAFPPFEASIAVICANEQGKFFDYHNYLFQHASEIKNADDLKTMAKDAGLNEAQFNSCYDFQKYLDEARAWYDQGQKDFEVAGVATEMRGTPAFFVNGSLILGAQPFETFVQGIEEKLGE